MVTEQQISEVRMAAAIATYWAAVDCHSGQNSEGYKALSIMSGLYKPGLNETSPAADLLDPEDFDVAEAYETLIDGGESLILQWAEWLKTPPTINDMLNSDAYQRWESDRLGNDLFINDPDRASRNADAAEDGCDGSTHAEHIQDWRDYIADSNYPEFVKLQLEMACDECEQWHIDNGSIDQVIG